MTRLHQLVRGALAASLFGAAACRDDHYIVLPAVSDPIFTSYVSLGNSLTAGYQSDGINDSTQARSYAVLLAKQMGTRFAYPSLAMPGCRPPLSNFLTQARVSLPGQPGGPSTSTTCFLRNPNSITDVINNVAVPGAGTFDADTVLGPDQSILTELFLGGKTQVQKALDAHPTFATVWLGNIDVLQPAITAQLAAATPLPAFVTHYAKAVNDLVTGAPGIKGVLLGVGQASAIPLMFDAKAFLNPAFKAGFDQFAGKTTTVDPTTCTPTTTSRIAFALAGKIRDGTFPPLIACAKGGPFPPPIGDFFVLDAAKQVQFANLVSSYNAYIKAKADSIGFAYYDPNTLLASLVSQGLVPTVPNLGSATAPFGQYFSLDGVHITAISHILLMNDLVGVINTKYGTHLVPLPTS